MPGLYECEELDELDELLYVAVDERPVVLLFTLSDDETVLAVVPAGLRWFATLPVGAGVVLLVVAVLFSDAALAGAVATRFGADVRLVTDEVALLPGCSELTLLTLVLLPTPPLVDTLLANTLSDPVSLLFPSHWSLM